MYLWIVIATFIVALFSYNLSVHPDIDRSYAETRANTVAASFQIQHNSLVSYVKSVGGHLKTEQFTQGEDGIEIQPNAYQSGAYYADGKFSSGQGVLDDEGIENFLPLGFKVDKKMVSKIYCFQRFMAPSEQVEVDTVTGSLPFDYSSSNNVPCSQENKVVLVSWRPIPQKWVNRQDSSLPTPDMIHAIARSNGYSTTFGYTMKKDNSNDYYISGGDHKLYEAITNDNAKPNLSDMCEKIPCFVSVSQIKY